MSWQDCFNDKFWVYICATGIVIVAMFFQLDGAEQLANVVLGGMFGSAVGTKA